jgi:hypothetical protein
MKIGPFVLSTVVASLALVFSTALHAQPKATDVVGIKLGMSVDEVRAAIKAHDPNMIVVEWASWNARPGVPASLAKLRGCIDPVKGTPKLYWACRDLVEVTFGHMSKKALFLHRSLDTGDSTLQQAVFDSLQGKYGRPTFQVPSQTQFPTQIQWTYTPAGAPVESLSCAIADSSGLESGQFRPQCGTVVSALVYSGNGTLARRFIIDVYQNQGWMEESALFNAAVKANQDQIENAAKGNKVKL